MKISACYILHYGAEWLYWSLRSVVDQVHDVHIFYTITPSHGHSTTLLCPESREDLRKCTYPLIDEGYDVKWHDCGPFRHEGEHRTFAVDTCERDGADVVLVVDADEIWDSDVLEVALLMTQRHLDARSFRIGMRHFWRSTKWVCDDAAMPTRLINVHNKTDKEEYIGGDEFKVFHFGYAQSPAIIEYKQSIHGHKAEWRPRWFENIFLLWKPGQGDVHPTNLKYWYPKLFDENPYRPLYPLIHDHPYWDKDIIE